MEIHLNICRICLEDNVVLLNWNEELFDSCGITFKECYYKYTQLEDTATDIYPPMLCKTCSIGLRNANCLFEKAVGSHKILEDTIAVHLAKNTKASSIIKYEDENERNKILEFKTPLETTTVWGLENEVETTEIFFDKEDTVMDEDDDMEEADFIEKLETYPLSAESTHKKKQKTLSEVDDKTSVTNNTSVNENKKNVVRRKIRRFMCAYCSKAFPYAFALKRHEETHSENRTRNEVCPHCGLKLYDTSALRNHLKVHTKNRQKNYKCEFCDKAFFNRGSLNVHRRIHLGQMIVCRICKREFYRQHDLDTHLRTHSAVPVQKDIKEHKYTVHCKECNKQVAVQFWKSHRASHLNQPQMKCTICDKNFFSRKSCTNHLRSAHSKTGDEYDKFMHYYIAKNEMRAHHLLLEQQETLRTAAK